MDNPGTSRRWLRHESWPALQWPHDAFSEIDCPSVREASNAAKLLLQDTEQVSAGPSVDTP